MKYENKREYKKKIRELKKTISSHGNSIKRHKHKLSLILKECSLRANSALGQRIRNIIKG